MVSQARQQIQTSGMSRVWVLPGQASPANQPTYEALARAGDLSWSLGDVTPQYIPDPNRYDAFVIAGQIAGVRGSPTMPITFYNRLDQRRMLDRLVRNACAHDVQVRFGQCRNPQDAVEGWEAILALENARPTNYTASNIGALAPGDVAPITEEVSFTGQDAYFIYRMGYGTQAEAQLAQEVVDVVICDSVTCGVCGIPSDGCSVVFVLTLSNGGSPGLPAELLYTRDGGATWSETLIDTLSPTENPNGMACVGENLVIISEDSESIHIANIASILAGTEVWSEVATGFVGGNGPLAIHSMDARHTWIVGENGYIYFTADPGSGVSVQDAGNATTENLNAIHSLDARSIIAVGNNNAVAITANGGQSWAGIVGPVPGVNLTAVYMKQFFEWLIGTAGGQLWYTRDEGDTWVVKTFPDAGVGAIGDIQFATNMIGYMAHNLPTPAGRMLRTVDGGFTWYIAPEGNLDLPANDKINALAVCAADPNRVYGGGLADNETDGYLVKGAGVTGLE